MFVYCARKGPHRVPRWQHGGSAAPQTQAGCAGGSRGAVFPAAGAARSAQVRTVHIPARPEAAAQRVSRACSSSPSLGGPSAVLL